MAMQSRARSVTAPSLRLAPSILALLLAVSFTAGLLANVFATTLSGHASGLGSAVSAGSFDAVQFRAQERSPLSIPVFDPVQFRADEHNLR